MPNSTFLEQNYQTVLYIKKTSCSTFFNFQLLKSLITEHLSIRGDRIPILLNLKKSLEMLKNALRICEEYLNGEEISVVFENGLLREMYDASTNNNRITLFRCIVRINARIFDKERFEFVKVADRRCKNYLNL